MTEKQKTYIVQNDIVCRNAIGRDKEQCLVIDLEDFANLTGSDLLDVVLAEINLGDSCVGSHDVWFVDLYFLIIDLYIHLFILQYIEYINLHSFSGSVSFCMQLRDRQLIAETDHLIEKEIEFDRGHLPTDGMISSEPDIGLFSR